MTQMNRRELLGAGRALGAIGAGAGTAHASIDPSTRKAGDVSPFKLGLAAYSYRQYLLGPKKSMTLLDFLDKCAEMGTDGAELTEYYFEKPVTAEQISRLKHRALMTGQTVVGTPIGNSFTAPAGEARNREIAKVKAWIDVSAELGSPVIRVFAGNTPAGLSETEARRNVVETLDALCEHASRRGVFLALENHGGVVATADGLLEIIKAVRCPWVGVNLDGGNFRTEDPYVDLACCAPYAVSCQFKVEIVRAGKREDADFARLLKILRDARYRGFVSLEYEAAEDPMTAVPRHIKAMRAIMDRA